MREGIANVRDKKTTTFETDNILPSWSDYSAVSKFKSVRRAIRRGHVDLFTGIIYPKRPFSNKKKCLLHTTIEPPVRIELTLLVYRTSVLALILRRLDYFFNLPPPASFIALALF